MKTALLYELEKECLQSDAEDRNWKPEDPQQQKREETPSKACEEMDVKVITLWTQRIFRRLLQNFETDYFPTYFLPRQFLTVKVEENENTLSGVTLMFCRMIIALLERSPTSNSNL